MAAPSTPVARRDFVAAALDQHAAALAVFVRGRVPPNEVQDVLQIAALRAVERADSLADPARVRGWLYQLHRNVAIDVARARASRNRLRERAATRAVTEVEPAPAELSLSDGLCRCSIAQVNRLSEPYATILKLVDLGDQTLAEASDTLGISVNNATVRLHRARRALRKRLFSHCATTSLRDCESCRCADDGCCDA